MGGRHGFSTHPIENSHTVQRYKKAMEGIGMTVQGAGRVGVPMEAGTIEKSG